jgi:hypothetical protein
VVSNSDAVSESKATAEGDSALNDFEDDDDFKLEAEDEPDSVSVVVHNEW